MCNQFKPIYQSKKDNQMNSTIVVNHIRFTLLNNGFFQLYDYQTGLSGLFNVDGSKHSGDLSINAEFVKNTINENYE